VVCCFRGGGTGRQSTKGDLQQAGVFPCRAYPPPRAAVLDAVRWLLPDCCSSPSVLDRKGAPLRTLALLPASSLLCSWPTTPSTMASHNNHTTKSGGMSTRSSTKRAANEGVIEVDALPTVQAAPTFSGKGKGPAKVARFIDYIDVDDPETWAAPMLSSSGGSASGAAFVENQAYAKTAVDNDGEDGSALKAGVVKTTNVVRTDTNPLSIADAPVAVPAFVAGSAGSKVLASQVPPVPGAVRGPGTHGRRARSHAKEIRAGLPRRFRNGKFVRRAAVMTVVPVPRMVARPPTPPRTGSGSNSGDAFYTEESGDDNDFDAGTDAGSGGIETDADAGHVADADEADGGQENANDNGDEHGTDDASQDVAARRQVPTPSAGELAQQLAARQCNPRVFTAACWMPDAQAVLAAAQVSRSGLPPIAPPSARRAVPVSATVRPVSNQNAPPSRSVPVSQSPVDEAEDVSSSDMDDDALVAAYITPPASPLPASVEEAPHQSPHRARTLSRKRRRGSGTPPVHAAAGAASSAPGEIEPVSLALHDVHESLRSGFASVRREITRMRAELVIVKSQAASTLRRIDGIAAAADGRESGSGVVLERLQVLDNSVRGLSERLPSSSPGGTADGDGATRNCVELVAEIKVRVCLVFCTLLLLVL